MDLPDISRHTAGSSATLRLSRVESAPLQKPSVDVVFRIYGSSIDSTAREEKKRTQTLRKLKNILPGQVSKTVKSAKNKEITPFVLKEIILFSREIGWRGGGGGGTRVRLARIFPFEAGVLLMDGAE